MYSVRRAIVTTAVPIHLPIMIPPSRFSSRGKGFVPLCQRIRSPCRR